MFRSDRLVLRGSRGANASPTHFRVESFITSSVRLSSRASSCGVDDGAVHSQERLPHMHMLTFADKHRVHPARRDGMQGCGLRWFDDEERILAVPPDGDEDETR